MLYWCNHCKENSVVRRSYTRQGQEARVLVEYCLNKGCGYRRILDTKTGEVIYGSASPSASRIDSIYGGNLRRLD